MTDQQQDIPRFASGVTAIHGISGAGKSELANTGAVYVAERFGKTTLCVAPDPGGWGNRRLSLIRQGVMQVYDPTNHVNYFDTMEKLTQGAWPETILDPDRGYADPNVRLLMPRQPLWLAKCPNGHVAAKYHYEAVMMASVATCPECGVIVNSQSQTTEKVIVRPALFARVGLRIFDSITAMSDRGQTLELPNMSGRGEVGNVLTSPDAIRQGDTIFGTGSIAQVGFMQNRAYGWLVNIRAIPDQVIGAICTFGTEASSSDDTRGGGEVCYGMALAGTARTARAGGWVGNLLHATKEPVEGRGDRHRLWLTNHTDPRDPQKRIYLAKHRGIPVGMPDFLEDPWSDDPEERKRNALTDCSLKKFFELLDAQYEQLAATDRERFAAFATAQADQDEIISSQQVATAVVPQAAVSVGAGRSLRSIRPTVAVAGPVSASPAPSVIQQQLEASLARQVGNEAGVAAAATQTAPVSAAGSGVVAAPAAPNNGNAAPAAAAGGGVGTAPDVGGTTPTPPVTNAPPPVPSRGLRRTARPPVA